MKSVRLYAANDLRVEEIPLPPAPGPDEVTLEVSYAGICGSDLHNFRTGEWISRSPSVAGHEFAGTVSALGGNVSHVAEGDRVIVDSRYVCGTCRNCADGLGQVCENLGFLGEVIDGGFAEAVTIPGRNVLRAPSSVPDRHLAMAEPLAVALHTLNKLALPVKAELVVAGCGPIGGLVALLASRQGHSVSVIDRNKDRAQLVAELSDANILALDCEWGADAPRYGVDATGSVFVIGQLIDKLAAGGAVGLVGIGHGNFEINPVTLVEKEMALVGCHAYGNELEAVCDLLPEVSPFLDKVIAEEISLDDVPDAYARHIANDVTGLKSLIHCREN